MIGLFQVTTVFLVTVLALAAASALHWVLLHAAFLLMRPVTIRRNVARNEIIQTAPPVLRAAANRR